MKHLWVYLMALLCLATSCASDDTPSTSTEKVTVHLVVALGGSSSSTRGTRADETVTDDESTVLEKAQGNEYYINPTDVEVLLYDQNNVFKDKAHIVNAIRVADNSNKENKYQLTGEFYNLTAEELNDGKQYKFVVVANANTSDCKLTDTNVEWKLNEEYLYPNLAYTYTETADTDGHAFTKNLLTTSSYKTSGSTHTIPMWGCKTAKLSDYVSTSQTSSSELTIDMLHAMAKVSVKLGDKLTQKNTTIQSVKLVGKHYNQGMIAPCSGSDYKYTPSNDEYAKAGKIYTGNATTSNTDVQFYQASDKTWYLFIPEQEAYQQDGDIKMNVTIANKTYNLYFADYSSGTPNYRKVLRNHWYEYIVTGIQEDRVELKLKYYVKNWTQKSETNITFD